jgi:hypothetical protein
MLMRRLLALLVAVALVVAAMEVRAWMYDEPTLLDRLSTGAGPHPVEFLQRTADRAAHWACTIGPTEGSVDATATSHAASDAPAGELSRPVLHA